MIIENNKTICSDDHGEIPLCSNPTRDNRKNTLESDEGGGGGPSLVNDPTRAEEVITDATGTEVEQTKRAQQSDQANGTPTGTTHKNVNERDACVNEADITMVQTDNWQQFEPSLNQEEDKEYEGEDYFPEGGYEDEVFKGEEYKDDDKMNINLLCNQQQRNVNFAGMSPISTDMNDCVIT